MGVVYRARQISLNRLVALKMILAGRLASSEEVLRLHLEAETAANLDHPGIVPIYEIGEHDGQHYFSMRYVAGRSLAARLQEGPLPAHEAARLLTEVCDAVQYAHEHGVIHRDLKPANIMLEESREPIADKFDADSAARPEVSSSGQPSPARILGAAPRVRPRVTDFGLAKRVVGDPHLTSTGQILGTPSYMAPELTAGPSHRFDATCDVYSLGAILYEILTGRPPFQGGTPLEMLTQVLESAPPPSRSLSRDVPPPLEAICMKCLEKDPMRRYRSARELRNDLVRYLEGDTVLASGFNLFDHVSHALRQDRHKEQFLEWGLGLMAFGLVIFLSHLAIFLLERWWHPSLLVYWLPRCTMYVALLILLWWFRRQSVLPTNSAERVIWVVWIGYLLSLVAVNSVRLMLGGDPRESYATFAILAGLGFLIMGGHAWGGGYAVGIAFLLSAPLLATHNVVAPLAFGALWAGALVTFGIHYCRLGRAAQAAEAGATR